MTKKTRSTLTALRAALDLAYMHAEASMHLRDLPEFPSWREGGYHGYLYKLDVWRLRKLGKAGAHVDASINRRAELIGRIQECAEGGQVALIESGMDCDCVQYSGRVHMVDATYWAVIKKEEDIAQWADGTFSLYVDKPSSAGRIVPESRDLVLEAFEDGHRHVVFA